MPDMAIVPAEKYNRLMSANPERIFAILANEVGMKKAREIAKRVISDEPMPEEAQLLKSY